MSRRTAAIVALLLAPATAGARKKLPPLTPDQQLVVAAAVEDTFPRPRHPQTPVVLCLDVQVSDDPLEEATPPPARGKKHTKPEPPLPIIQGAPPDVVARLSRPWRIVASALDCRVDPRVPIALADQTPAQLVTVRLTAYVATGSLRVDWTGGGAQAAGGVVNSRDCTATHGRRGWTVHCGGTWSE